MNNVFKYCTIFLLFFCLPDAAWAQKLLSDKSFGIGNNFRISFDEWKYKAGDDINWADEFYDDIGWEPANINLLKDELPKSGWNGKGWFRLEVEVDSSLINKQLVMIIFRAGNAEVFLNGSKIYSSFVTEFDEPDFSIFSFTKPGRNLFAVRYHNAHYNRYFDAGLGAGFQFSIGKAYEQVIRAFNFTRQNQFEQSFFTALTLALGFLHLILFFFSRNYKSNLYFALFMLIYAANIHFDYQINFAYHLWEVLINLRIHRAIMPVSQILLMLFIYSLFNNRLPKQFYLIAFLLIAIGLFAVYKPIRYFNYLQYAMLASLFEICRVIVVAIRKKYEGIWMVGLGFGLLFFFSSYDFMVDTRLIEQIGEFRNGYIYGLIGLFVCMSSFLAQDFSKRSQKLIEQEKLVKQKEIQQKLLAADNERKTRELEEARKIQLSMLPQCVNDLPGYDICFEMKTATEVGGDYYDYNIARDGTLNIAIGDATGHGTKAGLMVATVKSLFGALGSNLIITDFFQRCTEIIKKMRLGNLFMSMTLLRIKNGSIIFSSAGMPPVIIYRAGSGTIDEFQIKSMPLGAHENFPYEIKETTVDAGDVILLMSDGYPELFNEEREMLGIEKIKETLAKNGSLKASEIASELFKAGELWRGIRMQDDDITFVIIKIRNQQNSES